MFFSNGGIGNNFSKIDVLCTLSLKEIFHPCAEGMILVKHSELSFPIPKKEVPQKVKGEIWHSLIIYLGIDEATDIIQIEDGIA